MPAKKPATKAPPVRVPKKPTPPDRIPRVNHRPTLDDHLEIIARAVFQAGLSWALIDAAWPAYREAFEGFDCRKVAAYHPHDVERVLRHEGVMKSKNKAAAIVHNAQALLEVEREFGSVRAYLNSFGAYDAARADAKKRFKYLGDLNVYYWRFRVAAAVPPLEEWMQGQDRDHPRMREMVAAASESRP